jgi:hypothetical protein
MFVFFLFDKYTVSLPDWTQRAGGFSGVGEMTSTFTDLATSLRSVRDDVIIEFRLERTNNGNDQSKS